MDEKEKREDVVALFMIDSFRTIKYDVVGTSSYLI